MSQCNLLWLVGHQFIRVPEIALRSFSASADRLEMTSETRSFVDAPPRERFQRSVPVITAWWDLLQRLVI
jgi:hypothetical protein